MSLGRNALKALVPQSIRSGLWEARTWPAWWLSPRGRESRRRLARLQDRFRGRTCVVMGNGPSLRRTDLGSLGDVVTIGSNRAYLLERDRGFTPDYLLSVNRLVIEQCIDDFLRARSRVLLDWNARDLVPDSFSGVFLRCLPRPRFSRNPGFGVWTGATVTYVALQLAYHMGFRKVVLVGVDHHFETKGPAHRTVSSRGDDPNHFAPDYFGAGFRWQLPDLETSEIAYRMAREAFEADGRQIVDATVGGRLEVFPRVELLEALSGSVASS